MPEIQSDLARELDFPELDAWREPFEAIKKKIQRAPVVSDRLKKLKKAGADPLKILAGLAFVVSNEQDKSITRFFKSRQRHFVVLANRLRRDSDEIKNTLLNPYNSSRVMKILFFPEIFTDFVGPEELQKISSAVSNRMELILGMLEMEANTFGRLKRKYQSLRRTDYLRGLLRYVKESTGQFQDEIMADLLQAAHEALDMDVRFSAWQLRKLRQRKLPDVIRKRGKSTLLDPFEISRLGKLDKLEG